MRADTGESTSSIIKRGDDRAWAIIEPELRAGSKLRRIPMLKRSYCDGGKAHIGCYGPGISDTRLRKLEREGIVRNIGVDLYALAEQVRA